MAKRKTRKPAPRTSRRKPDTWKQKAQKVGRAMAMLTAAQALIDRAKALLTEVAGAPPGGGPSEWNRPK